MPLELVLRLFCLKKNGPLSSLVKKLNEAIRKFSTYDKEFNAIVRALEHLMEGHPWVMFKSPKTC